MLAAILAGHLHHGRYWHLAVPPNIHDPVRPSDSVGVLGAGDYAGYDSADYVLHDCDSHDCDSAGCDGGHTDSIHADSDSGKHESNYDADVSSDREAVSGSGSGPSSELSSEPDSAQPEPPTVPVSKAQVARLNAALDAHPGFAPLPDSVLNKISAGLGFTCGEVLSQWRMVTAWRARSAHFRLEAVTTSLKKDAPPVLTASQALTLARAYRVPPQLILRAASAASVAVEDSSLVSASDLGSPEHARRTGIESRMYEEAVQRRLQTIVPPDRLRTEEQFRAEGKTPTPDFVIRGGVTAEELARCGFRCGGSSGSKLYWIDAKNYPAFDAKIVMKNLESAAEKYTKAFGPGAFVFNGRIMEGSRMAALPAESFCFPVVL